MFPIGSSGMQNMGELLEETVKVFSSSEIW